MTDTVTYMLPGGAELSVPTTLVPRKGEVVTIGGKEYSVVAVSYDIKLTHHDEPRGTDAIVFLESVEVRE